MIVFEAFTGTHGASAGSARLRASSLGLDGGLQAGDSFGAAYLVLRSSGEDEGTFGLVITVPDAGGAAILVSSGGQDASHSSDAGAVFVYARATGIDMPPGDSAGSSTLYALSRGQENTPLTAYAFFVPQLPMMFGYAGVAFEVFEESVVLSDEQAVDWSLLLTSAARMADQIGWVQRLAFTLESSATARAVWEVIVDSDFESAITITDDVDHALRVIVALADQLHVHDETVSYMDALITIASALVMRDTVHFGRDVDVESLIEIIDEATDHVEATLDMVSEAEITDEMQGALILSTLLTSEAHFTASTDTLLSALVDLFDSADFTVRFQLPDFDGELFVGYAMNLRNGGMTRYENYPFVDFATVGGVHLAVAEDGLYQIDGDDDDGAPIHARVRTGLTSFGTEVLKKNPNMYLTLRSDGELLLRVITTDGGRKKENWYKLHRREATEPVEGRFDIAKGLTSVYWGYQIENIAGADFELATIKSWPFVVQRRKSGR